jgi:hypothetical protein
MFMLPEQILKKQENKKIGDRGKIFINHIMAT